MNDFRIIQGDCREVLPTLEANSVHCCVTSPPYWGLRDYGVNGQLGLEPTYQEYVQHMVEVFREVRRILRDDGGTLWLNLGDSYVGGGRGGGGSFADERPGWDGVPSEFGKKRGLTELKPKDLCGIPWRVAFALQADGWYLRQDIIWHKPNPMPESVTDRCTKSHEYLFLLAKSQRYYYDAEAIKEMVGEPTRRQKTFRGGCYTNNTSFDNSHDYSGHDPYSDDEPSLNGRNKRSVWTVATQPYPDAHFATFPPALIDPCIKAGCPEGGTVLDPFHGSGTTGEVAIAHGCCYIGIELNQAYIDMSMKRFAQARLF